MCRSGSSPSVQVSVRHIILLSIQVMSAEVNPFEVVYELLIEFPTKSFTKVVTLILYVVLLDKYSEGVTEKVLLVLDALGVEDI